ncbi:Uncharacterised protein [Rikenella microfusus]|uniref:Uncharacterized protein n=1 Tax=Rikenella microfusus TaxID=28139 RepID=A0A379MQC8_9BACT|nr:Uncharacterised protein [Rikenella microfusus]
MIFPTGPAVPLGTRIGALLCLRGWAQTEMY